MKDLILFIDSGDTLVDESTEIRDDTGVVVQAELIPGAAEAVRTLWRAGATALPWWRMDCAPLLTAYTGSMGWRAALKPGPYRGTWGSVNPMARMFISAMEQMGLTDADKDRIVMVGNNLERDIAGANRLGLTSILMSWTTRYRLQPRVPEETPDFVVARPDELPALLAELDRQMKKRRDPASGSARCRTVTDKPFSPQPEPCCSAGKTVVLFL